MCAAEKRTSNFSIHFLYSHGHLKPRKNKEWGKICTIESKPAWTGEGVNWLYRDSVVSSSVSILFISFFTKYNSHTVAWVLVGSKLFQSLDIPENSNKNRVNSLPHIDLDFRQKGKGLAKIIHTSPKGNTFGEGNFCWRSRRKLLETHSQVKTIPVFYMALLY